MRMLYYLIIAFFLVSCQDDEPTFGNNGNSGGNSGAGQAWSIPIGEILDGGVGKDGIPSIDDPQFSTIAGVVSDMEEDDLVIVVKQGADIKAYPHNILDYHEIVNDEVGEINVAITYCPLTGTAIGWDREINGFTATFGVSGFLYNSNLIPYDRLTQSNYSQMLNQGVNGPKINVDIKTHQVVEMSWRAFKEIFPREKVMTRETGFSRPYGDYPYLSYKTDASTLFPIANQDDRIFSKDRVHGIQVGDITRVYEFDSFSEGEEVLYDEVNGKNITVFGDVEAAYIVSFEQMELNGEPLTFEWNPAGENGVIANDQFENQWNMFGEAVSGRNAGEKMIPTNSYMGYYFAWVAFDPNVEIYGR